MRPFSAISKILLTCFLLISSAPSILAEDAAAPEAIGSGTYEYILYTVKRGDTLWSISKKNLKDAFQWPQVWQENLRLNNPDKIFPGDVIKIPVSVKKQEVMEKVPVAARPAEKAPAQAAVETPKAPMTKPAVKEEPKQAVAAAKPVEYMPSDSVLPGGYIAIDVPYVGEISGSLIGSTIFGKGDELYLHTASPAKAGTKYYVIRKESRVKHPFTDDYMGSVIKVMGVIEVVKAAPTVEARVLTSFGEVKTGDYIDDYYEVEPVPILEQPRPLPAMEGVVVASNYMKDLSGRFDVVFIDKGRKDGLEPGDVLTAVTPGTADRSNGTLRLINIRPDTSTALVLDSRGAIGKGDKVIGLK